MRVSGRVPYFIPETPDYIQRKRVNSQTRCTQEREGMKLAGLTRCETRRMNETMRRSLFHAPRLLDEDRAYAAWNAESASTFYNPRASELASVAIGCHFDQRLFRVAVLAN